MNLKNPNAVYEILEYNEFNYICNGSKNVFRLNKYK